MGRVHIGRIVIVLIFSGCAALSGKTSQEKRQALLSMRNEVLADLYKVRPQAKAQVGAAPGYAVFSNASINIILRASAAVMGLSPTKKARSPFS